MSEPRFLVWTDLETTGTDETRDQILEVGMVITQQTDLAVLGEFEITVWPWRATADEIKQTVSPFVRAMHENNGLWRDAELNGVPDNRAASEVISWLSKFGSSHEFVMAGSGVAHFDRRFFAARMPRVLDWFRYYSLDMGVIRRSMEYSGNEDLLLPRSQAGKNHRALDDARLHLQEYRYFLDQVGKLKSRQRR